MNPINNICWPALVFVTLVAVVAAPTVASAETGTVRGRVKIKKGSKYLKDRSNIVVQVHAKGKLIKGVASIRQRNRTFLPSLTVVTKNSTVEFPNQDKIFHNVFSLSKTARFDLGLYKSGSSKSVKLRRDGVINVYCNIHPEMVAQIRVVDTPYYAVTGKDGSFSIDGIPEGTYPISAWISYGKEYKGKITVVAGKPAVVNISLTAGSPPRSHKRKDGTLYGRYE